MTTGPWWRGRAIPSRKFSIIPEFFSIHVHDLLLDVYRKIFEQSDIDIFFIIFSCDGHLIKRNKNYLR